MTATLFLGLAGAAGASSGDNEGTRVALAAHQAKANGLAVRQQLLGGKVSAHVTAGQLRSLQGQGITYEVIPRVTIYAPKDKPGGGTGGGSERPAQPAAQVPYGIKMVYGNPSLGPNDVTGGHGINVAVLDTGSVDHFDFVRKDGSNIITDCVDFAQRKANQVEGQCQDGQGHGTHVTGTVAAAGGLDGLGIFGAAPDANIFSYRVLDNRGAGYADDIARAIMVAADRGAQIISMSLGSSLGSAIYLDAIEYAVSKGVLVIAAAGNSGPEADTIGYPAAYQQVVAVAALNPDESVAYFSSRGILDGDDATIAHREVEVAGPGRNTLSTYKDGKYYTMSGTSMAAPHIAGLAAKQWQGDAQSTRVWLQSQAQLHDITQAEQINNAGLGYDIASGYGLPQVTPLTHSLWSN